MPNAQLQSWSIPAKATKGQTYTLYVGLLNTGDAGYIEPELEVQDYIAGQWVNRRYIYATPQYKWAESGLGGVWVYVDFPIFFTMPNVEAVAFYIFAYAWVNNAWQMTVNAVGPFIMQAEIPAAITRTATVTVTNRSTRLGVASPALLFTEISVLVGGIEIGSLSEQHSFAAGASYSISFPFTIQATDFGKSGSVSVVVLDPSGRQIASGAKAFTT